MERRDVVICGGGIGGLALGIRLRQFGIHPVVIERQVGVRPLPKGEFFQPQGVAKLREFGLLDEFLKHGATQIRTVSHTFREPLLGRLERFELKYPDYDGIDFGLAALHEDILVILRREYARLGGELREGCFVRAIGELSDAATAAPYLVELSTGEKLAAHVFVGADGRHSPSRKLLGMELIEFPCERFMMAALLENVQLPGGEFYTEEVPGGVVYAFGYNDGSVRGYMCFEKPDLERANRDKTAYFLEKLSHTSLKGRREARFQGPIMIMPTVDTMLSQRAEGSSIWFGDAAGTVDPLGGHGMSLALTDASRIADAIRANLAEAREGDARPLARAFKRISRVSRQDYLHTRFLDVWIGILFMGAPEKGSPALTADGGKHYRKTSRIRRLARWGKWIATRRYREDDDLRAYLVDLFAGVNRDPFALHDLPYLLGVFPGGVRRRLSRLRVHRWLLRPQNEILTVPLKLQKKRFLGVLPTPFGLKIPL